MYMKHLCFSTFADVAELADALVLGTSVNDVEVRVLSSAPIKKTFKQLNVFFFAQNNSAF